MMIEGGPRYAMSRVYFHSSDSNRTHCSFSALMEPHSHDDSTHLTIHNVRIINVSCLAVIRALQLLSHGMLGVFGESAISET